MITDFGWYSVPAAMALMGDDAESLAAELSIPESALENWEMGPPATVRLTRGQFEMVRARYRRWGVFLIETPWFRGVIQVAAIEAFQGWCRYAEQHPASKNNGCAFALFARTWRAWLRLSGQGDRLGPETNGVRASAKDGE